MLKYGPIRESDCDKASSSILEYLSGLGSSNAKFAAHAPEIGVCRDLFRDAVTTGTVHELDRDTFKFADLTKEEVSVAYSDGMVDLDSEGRIFYQLILKSEEWCAFCMERDTSQVDHYLPKENFFALAVALENLIPICFKCNQRKGRSFPKTVERTVFHPRHEDEAHTTPWLEGVVASNPEHAVLYRVNPTIASPFRERVSEHFRRFALSEFYSALMSRSVTDSIDDLRAALREDDVPGVIDECNRHIRQGLKHGVNHWRVAGWQACREDSSFVAGGFESFVV